jgi:hypothetical protein
MAYNRKNLLRRAIKVQDIYLEHRDSGLSNREIYKRYIKYRWDITEATFYNYLALPAKRDLKRLEEAEKQ